METLSFLRKDLMSRSQSSYHLLTQLDRSAALFLKETGKCANCLYLGSEEYAALRRYASSLQAGVTIEGCCFPDTYNGMRIYRVLEINHIAVSYQKDLAAEGQEERTKDDTGQSV